MTRIEYAPGQSEATLAAIPSSSAVFLLRGDAGSEPYASKTADLRRRLTRLLGSADQNKRFSLNLRERCRTIEYWLTGSDFESTFLLYRTLRAEFPQSYRDRLKLRFPPFIKLDLENPYPRAYITRRIAKLPSKTPSRYYGPFPSRAVAEKFLNDALDFYKMRRCDFELNPDPSFPGCVYSEMKMCLAPCFKGCTDEAYHQEVARVRSLLDSRGESLLRELTAERERASVDLQFEAAAATHARWEKAKSLAGAAALPEIVRPITELNALIIQRSSAPHEVELFSVNQGVISGPVIFAVQPNALDPANAAAPKAAAPQSMESRVAQALQAAPAARASSTLELNEHLAILKRWYYRSRRAGEIFFADQSGGLPLRRIVRGIGRVLKGEDPEAAGSEDAHRAYWLARTREET
jgi:excinuclease ABC subunit C